MFATLIESRAAHVRRRGGAAASAVVHTALIFSALVATGRTKTRVPPSPPDVVPVTFAPLPSQDNGPADRSQASSGAQDQWQLPPSPRPLPPIGNIPGTTIDIDHTLTDAGIVQPGTFAGPVTAFGTGGYASGPITGPYLPDQVEHVAVLRRAVRPPYPPAMQRAGLSGRVVVRFVVDTTGLVEAPSVEVRAATHPEFERAVRAILPELRFEPATAGGHRVRMLVEMPFEFALDAR